MELSLENKKIRFPFLISASIFLLPYDAIRGTMPSVYRPISLYPLVIFLLLYIVKNGNSIKINKNIKNLIAFFIWAVVVGVLVSIIKTEEFSFFKGELFSLTSGIIVFLSMYFGMNILHKKYTVDIVVDKLFILIGIAYIFPTIIALIDILTVYGPLPYSVKELIMSIFGGFQPTRLTGTTLEASWLTKHALFTFPVYLYLYNTRKKISYLFLLLTNTVIFLATFSLQGMGYLTVGIILFILLEGYRNTSFSKNFKKLISSILVLSIFLFIFYYFIVNILPPSYFTNRIKNFTNIESLIKSDASAFIRIGMPWISLLMFKDNIILGNGLGSYPFFFPKYINEYFPYSLSFNEVQSYYNNLSAPGGSMLFRVFGDLGLIGAGLFYYFLIYNLKKIKNLKLLKNGAYITLLISLCVAFLTQEGYASIQFWFSMGILSSFTSKKDFKISATI